MASSSSEAILNHAPKVVPPGWGSRTEVLSHAAPALDIAQREAAGHPFRFRHLVQPSARPACSCTAMPSACFLQAGDNSGTSTLETWAQVPVSCGVYATYIHSSPHSDPTTVLTGILSEFCHSPQHSSQMRDAGYPMA